MLNKKRSSFLWFLCFFYLAVISGCAQSPVKNAQNTDDRNRDPAQSNDAGAPHKIRLTGSPSFGRMATGFIHEYDVSVPEERVPEVVTQSEKFPCSIAEVQSGGALFYRLLYKEYAGRNVSGVSIRRMTLYRGNRILLSKDMSNCWVNR